MTVDPAVVPGLLLLALELLARRWKTRLRQRAAVGYVVARVALRQSDDRMALAQGLVIGLALWGLLVNFVLHVLPGAAALGARHAAALGSWVIVLVIGVANLLLADWPGVPGGWAAAPAPKCRHPRHPQVPGSGPRAPVPRLFTAFLGPLTRFTC